MKVIKPKFKLKQSVNTKIGGVAYIVNSYLINEKYDVIYGCSNPAGEVKYFKAFEIVGKKVRVEIGFKF